MNFQFVSDFKQKKLYIMSKKAKKDNEKSELKELPIVEFLESRAKCGFRTEKKDDQSYCEPLFRLVCDSQDPDAPAVNLTPYCTASVLVAWIQGALYLQPLLVGAVQQHNKNAKSPEEKNAES